MSAPWPVALVVPLLAALAVGVSVRPFLRALPEPEVGRRGVTSADLAAKIPYRALTVPRFRLGCATLTAAAGLVVVVLLPPSAWPGWLPVATVGVVAAAIDAVTTWLPRRLTRVGWLLVALTAPATLLVGGGPADAGRLLGGALAAFAVFWVVWRVSRGGLAYGDVRLAPVLGAAGGTLSWTAVFVVLLLGTVLGALHGLLRHLRGRRGPFPYAPGLVAGALLTPIVLSLG